MAMAFHCFNLHMFGDSFTLFLLLVCLFYPYYATNNFVKAYFVHAIVNYMCF